MDPPTDEDPSPGFQKRKILAVLFEQFLLFDKIAIKIDRENLELHFLIEELGINNVEELLDHGIIIPVLWTPMIIMSMGITQPDGSVNQEAVIGTPPLVAGRFTSDDSDPEKNLDKLLNRFSLHKDRKRIFKKKVTKKFVLPDNKIADSAAEIVVDAYVKGRLKELGLNNDKEPSALNVSEREKLFQLGNQVLETTILAEKGYRSFNKYPSFNLTKESIRSIESAYHVSENTSQIFKIENLADLQSYFLENNVPFEKVFDLRYKPNVKHYRKWINTLSINTDTKDITREYIDEIQGKSKFFESSGGKFVKTMGLFGLGSGIGTALAGAPGALAGTAAGKLAELGLSFLDEYVLDGVLKGWNPRMFVDEWKLEQEKNK